MESDLETMIPSTSLHMKRAEVINLVYKLGQLFELSRATIHLAITYLEQLFQTEIIPENELQCIVIATLWIAQKIEEDIVWFASDFVKLMQGLYYRNKDLSDVEKKRIKADSKDLLRYEHKVLKVLNWKLYPETAHQYLGDYLCTLQASDSEMREAMEALDLMRMFVESEDYEPDVIASTVLVLLGADAFLMEELTGYAPQEIEACAAFFQPKCCAFRRMKTCSTGPYEGMHEHYPEMLEVAKIVYKPLEVFETVMKEEESQPQLALVC